MITTLTQNSASRIKDILTHCRRELMHEVWRILLDAEFIQAYNHGLVINCFDGVVRRVYPRIFTYSADYPEKYCAFPSLLSALLNFITESFWPLFGTWEFVRAHVVPSQWLTSSKWDGIVTSKRGQLRPGYTT
jgi:hypothetical protein